MVLKKTYPIIQLLLNSEKKDVKEISELNFSFSSKFIFY